MLNSFSRAHASELYNCIYKLPASWPKACIELGVAIDAVTGDLKTVPIFKKKKRGKKGGVMSLLAKGISFRIIEENNNKKKGSFGKSPAYKRLTSSFRAGCLLTLTQVSKGFN